MNYLQRLGLALIGKSSAVGDLRVGFRKDQPIYTTRASENRAAYAPEALKATVAYAAIRLVATVFASIPWQIGRLDSSGNFVEEPNHDLNRLWAQPNPQASGPYFRALWSMYYSIHGESPIERVLVGGGREIFQLYNTEPENIAPVYNSLGEPSRFEYRGINGRKRSWEVDPVDGQSNLRFIRAPNPVEPFRGLAPTSAGARPIDGFNAGQEWNASLLQNSAQPSGVLNVEDDDLTDEQIEQMKQQLKGKYSGPGATGEPLVLDGKYTWNQIGLTPREMDFIEGNRENARLCALTYGVPPMLLGIPGDNTYSNYQEARLALFDDTILPLAYLLSDEMRVWNEPFYQGVFPRPCVDKIEALNYRKERKVEALSKANWMTIDEKRNAMGLEPLGPERGGDLVVSVAQNTMGLFDIDDPEKAAETAYGISGQPD